MTDERTTTCPFCAMDVSVGVTSCPNCGGLIAPSSSDATPGEPQPSPASVFRDPPAWPSPPAAASGSSRRALIGVVVAVALLGVGIAAVVAMMSFESGPEGRTAGPTPIVIDTNVTVPGVLDGANPTRVYEFMLRQRGIVSMMVVSDFDNYLELYRGSESSPFEEDDDSGGNLDAQITVMLEPGTYFALVRPYSEGTTGSFTIQVTAPGERQGSGSPPVSPPPPPPPVRQEIPHQHRSGVVAGITGTAPVAGNSPCDVYITPAEPASRFTCRIRVYCNGTILYGHDDGRTRYGYNDCATRSVADGLTVIEAHDRGVTEEDGDPRIDLDTSAGQISVTDRGPAGLWTAIIRFTSAADGASPPTP